MSKSSSLVRRPDQTTPPKLTRPQSSVLSDALRMGEATRNVMEASLVEYGSWILGHVFGDDAAAALDVKSQNPIWLALIHRAGGPTLRVSRRMLYVAVEIAARDKRINDGVWRALEPGRKELLLPIGDEAEMRKAARHVVEMKMSQDSTREYVASLRAQAGDAPKSRMTISRVTTQIGKFHKTLGATAALRELRKAASGATDAQKAALAKELDGVAKWLTEARRVLK